MKRAFRLTRPADFERVRRYGESHAHPFVVLIRLANDQQKPRIGIAASRKIGKATARNRAKRLLREAMRPLVNNIEGGEDILLLARADILNAKSVEVESALKQLLRQAGLNIEKK